MVKNHKQLLADFYLELFNWSTERDFKYYWLMSDVRDALASELKEEPETIQRIFERMAAEDGRSK